MVDQYRINTCRKLLNDYAIWKERYLDCLSPNTSRPDRVKTNGQPEDKAFDHIYYRKKIDQVEKVLYTYPVQAAYIRSHYDLPEKVDDSWSGIVSSLYFLACSI